MPKRTVGGHRNTMSFAPWKHGVFNGALVQVIEDEPVGVQLAKRTFVGRDGAFDETGILRQNLGHQEHLIAAPVNRFTHKESQAHRSK